MRKTCLASGGDWIRFVVDHEPVPQPRTRSGKTRKGATVHYVDKGHKVHTFKGFVARRFQEARPKGWDTGLAYEVGMTLFFKPPAKRGQVLAREYSPKEQADLDNVAKAILDGLNGVAWNDDRQVCLLTVRKEYALLTMKPCVHVGIRGIGSVIRVQEWESVS